MANTDNTTQAPLSRALEDLNIKLLMNPGLFWHRDQETFDVMHGERKHSAAKLSLEAISKSQQDQLTPKINEIERLSTTSNKLREYSLKLTFGLVAVGALHVLGEIPAEVATPLIGTFSPALLTTATKWHNRLTRRNDIDAEIAPLLAALEETRDKLAEETSLTSCFKRPLTREQKDALNIVVITDDNDNPLVLNSFEEYTDNQDLIVRLAMRSADTAQVITEEYGTRPKDPFVESEWVNAISIRLLANHLRLQNEEEPDKATIVRALQTRAGWTRDKRQAYAFEASQFADETLAAACIRRGVPLTSHLEKAVSIGLQRQQALAETSQQVDALVASTNSAPPRSRVFTLD